MHQIKLVEPSISLETVVKNFEHWRSVRKSRGKIPSELMEQAFSLVGSYPLTHISTALKFNNTDFKKKCISKGLIVTENDKPRFIQVETKHTDMINDDNIHIELYRADGAKMRVHLSKSVAVSQAINQFLKG